MAQKIVIKEEIYGRSVRRKKQGKMRYNRGVKSQYFILSDLVLFKDSTPYLGKLTEQWRGLFIINNFGGDRGVSYILKTLDGEPAPNTYYGDQLRIFCPKEEYLRPAHEEPLMVTCNLRFKKKKD